MHIEGYQYTWSRQKGKHDAIEEKLDKGFVTMDWLDLCPNFKLINGIAAKLDHSPIMICLNVVSRRKFQKKSKFENSWLDEPKLDVVIRIGWSMNLFDDLMSKTDSCQKEMNTWRKRLRPKYQDQIEDCRKQLEHACQSNGEEVVSQYHEISEKLKQLIA